MRSLERAVLVLLAAAVIPACGGSSNDKPPVTLAVPPSTLIATPRSTARIDLTWADNSDNEFEFRIERSDDLGFTYSQVGTSTANSPIYSDFGLLPGRQYFYRVTAWNGKGSSAFAGPANATTASMTWKSATGGPGIRGDHSAIYDSLGLRMILFGGQDDFFTYFNDVWSLDLSQTTTTLTQLPLVDFWTPLTTSGTPPTERFGHSAIYDVQFNRMIVFGGQDITVPPVRNDVWILTLGPTPVWSQATVSGSLPSPRSGHTAIYDLANQRMVVFGGNDLVGENSETYFLSLPQNPPFVWSSGPTAAGLIKRTEHSAVYDGFRQQMMIFGGLDHTPLPDGSDLNADSWTLDLTGSLGWIQRSFPGTPFVRQGHTSVYDAFNQRMVVFGGDTTYGFNPTASVELWALRLDTTSTWTFLNPSSGTPPPARYGHTAIYDSGKQRMVLYGGYDSSPFPAFGDTWMSDF